MAVMGVWAFILCNRHRWHIKQNKKPWKHTKQMFPEQKTKKSFVLHNLCPAHEVLTGIWNPLISAQIVNSFGQGKCTFDCQAGNLKNYASCNHVSTSSCMLRIVHWSPSTLLVCGHFIQIHSCMSTSFSCMYTNNYKHFHKGFGIFYSDNSVLRGYHIFSNHESWLTTFSFFLLNCILSDIAWDHAPQWGKTEKKGLSNRK